MNLNQIAGAVEYCKRHEFFQASSVFISQIENIDSRVTTLCLIYKDNTAQIKFNPTGKCDYNFTFSAPNGHRHSENSPRLPVARSRSLPCA